MLIIKTNRKTKGAFLLIAELIVEMGLIGFLFLFILVTFFASAAFGNKIGMSDFDSDAELQKINNDPNKFKISIVLALIEKISVIILAIMVFIFFSPYSLILGVVWAVFRIGEGLIQVYNEKKYWKLRNIARKYSGSSGTEKNALSDLARSILKTRNSRFTFAMVFWSIGTLAFSIVLVTSGVVPEIIGWLGIVASILSGFGNGIKLVKPNFEILSTIGGLSAILFEVIIGGWLLFLGINIQ